MGMIPFNFSGEQVRVLRDDAHGALFHATDVAAALGYARPGDAVRAHCKGAVKRRILTAGGEQEVLFIPERDVYRLVMRSRLPSAEQFEEWVVATVLPSIRQHGGYVMGQEAEQDPQLIMARALQVAQSVIDAKTAALAQAQQTLQAQAPKVEFYEAVAASHDSCTMADIARTIGAGRTRLMAALRARKVLMSDNQPYQRYIDAGYFLVRERAWKHPITGRDHQSFTTIVTGRGQDFVRRQWVAYQQEKEVIAQNAREMCGPSPRPGIDQRDALTRNTNVKNINTQARPAHAGLYPHAQIATSPCVSALTGGAV